MAELQEGGVMEAPGDRMRRVSFLFSPLESLCLLITGALRAQGRGKWALVPGVGDVMWPSSLPPSLLCSSRTSLTCS